MNYDPSTHLLRPLKEGEVIEATDLVVGSKGIVPTSHAGDTHTSGRFLAHFRPVEVPRWRAILSAPIDGTPVVIAWHDGSVWQQRIAWWEAEFSSKCDKDRNITLCGAWTDNAVAHFGYEETHSYEPTHWMPCFSPPEMTEKPSPADQSRREFEALCKDLSPAFDVIPSYKRAATGEYINDKLEKSWQAWQKAREGKV